MLLIEQADEWLVQRRYLSGHSIKLVLSTEPAQTEHGMPRTTRRRQPSSPRERQLPINDDQNELHHEPLLDRSTRGRPRETFHEWYGRSAGPMHQHLANSGTRFRGMHRRR